MKTFDTTATTLQLDVEGAAAPAGPDELRTLMDLELDLAAGGETVPCW